MATTKDQPLKEPPAPKPLSCLLDILLLRTLPVSKLRQYGSHSNCGCGLQPIFLDNLDCLGSYPRLGSTAVYDILYWAQIPRHPPAKSTLPTDTERIASSAASAAHQKHTSPQPITCSAWTCQRTSSPGPRHHCTLQRYRCQHERVPI